MKDDTANKSSQKSLKVETKLLPAPLNKERNTAGQKTCHWPMAFH